MNMLDINSYTFLYYMIEYDMNKFHFKLKEIIPT